MFKLIPVFVCILVGFPAVYILGRIGLFGVISDDVAGLVGLVTGCISLIIGFFIEHWMTRKHEIY